MNLRARDLAKGGSREWITVLFLALVVMGTVGLSAAWRQEGVPRQRIIWAEDGPVYADCALRSAPTDCLLRPYGGYLQLTARLGALVAPMGSLDKLPLRLFLVSTLIAALCAALISVTLYRAAPGTAGGLVAGFLGGTAIGFVEAAGMEVLGNLANIHWIVLAAATVALVGHWLGVRAGFPAALVILLATLTSAIAPFILVPLACVGILLRRREAVAIGVVTLAGSLGQAAFLVIGPHFPRVPPALDPVLFEGAVTGLLRWGWFGARAPFPDLVVPTALGLVLLLLVVRRRPLGALAVAALAASGMAAYFAAVAVNHAVGVRYQYLPTVLGIAALGLGTAIVASTVGDRRVRIAAPVVLAVLLLGGFLASFRLWAWGSTGPDFGAQVRASGCELAVATEEIVLDISPQWKETSFRWRAPCGGR